MRRFRLTLEYDGLGFRGWQVQDEGRSVQGVLESAIARVSGDSPRVHAAGRTDAGVHARGQVVHFDADTRLSPLEMRRALNAVLPDDAAVRGVEVVPPSFDARRSALCKRYVYRILEGPVRSPLRRGRVWHVRGPLDLGSMRQAATWLQGTHDFAAFRGAPGGAPARERTRRTLELLEPVRVGDELEVRCEARSFLRYMVRNLVGTLVEVGLGRRKPEDVVALLSSGSRAAAGPTAPAHGLCLEEVRY
ncbi:MAG: tRNA pseudouridine(38-40) synthase TruA [Myxococcota bacterium]